jgi:hypothetical protein
MRRREFIAGAGSVAAWPMVARGQQSPVPLIGYVTAGFPNTFPNLTLAFQQGLNESGFTEGKTVIVERRYAEGRFDQLPNLVGELARHHVDLAHNPKIKEAFLRGLREQGYTEGRNVTIEDRFADNQYDRLPALAADLKPADLPVVQSVKLELVINLKTAKSLGLDIPPTLIARADEVIE